ncbi:MAG: DcrB-related protein [Polyangiaceae bacterium]|nr:DcrB-related protein [Polyangiaceae bacterium]
MSGYVLHMDELVVEVPEGFQDHSVQALEWRPDPDTRVTLTIGREPRKNDEGLEDAASRVMAALARRVASFKEDEPLPLEIDLPVVTRRARFRHEGELVYRHIAFVDLEDRLVIVSASSPTKRRDLADEVLMSALRSARVRER